MPSNWPRWTLLGMLCALQSGCGWGESPFEGTWLFMIDLEVDDIEGSCANEDETFEQEGLDYQWVDMHSPGKNRLTVLLDEVLMGEIDGKAFNVISESSVEYSGYYMEESMIVTGTLAKGIITGQIARAEESAQGNKVKSYEFDCEMTWNYTAERSVSHDEQYSEVEE